MNVSDRRLRSAQPPTQATTHIHITTTSSSNLSAGSQADKLSHGAITPPLTALSAVPRSTYLYILIQCFIALHLTPPKYKLRHTTLHTEKSVFESLPSSSTLPILQSVFMKNRVLQIWNQLQYESNAFIM